jgi:hypothetical protein
MILLSTVSIVFSNGIASDDMDTTQAFGGRASRLVVKDADWDVTGNEPFTDEIIVMNGNVTIGNGATLDLTNTTIIMNQNISLNYVYTISVESGGTLKMSESTITNNASSEYDFQFLPGSTGTIDDSTISNCGSNSNQGLIIQSTDITFTNSILDSNYNGINCLNATVTIKDSLIDNSGYTAIMANNSQITIWNSTISNSDTRDADIEAGSNLSLVSTPISTSTIIIEDSSLLEVAWWLTVNVTAQNGSPLAGALVEVWDILGINIIGALADANGQVTWIKCVEYVKNITMEKEFTPHIIKAFKEEFIQGQQSKTIDSDMTVEIKLEPQPKLGSITGLVTNEGKTPIEGINVSVTIDGKNIFDITDISGRYLLTELTPGTNYSMMAKGKIGHLDRYYDNDTENADVFPDNVTAINFILKEKPLPVQVKVQVRAKFEDADGAENVDYDTRIVIYFDNPMDNSTVNTDNVKITQGTLDVPIEDIKPLDLGTFTQFEIELVNSDLLKEKEYTILISKNVKRIIAGESVVALWANYLATFETEVEAIQNSFPVDGSIDISATNPIIYVTFHISLSLNQTSLEDSFGVQLGQIRIAGSLEIDYLTNKVTFKPSDELRSLTTYTVVVSDDLIDLDGKFIIRDGISREWSFTTEKTTTEITGQLMNEDGKPVKGAKITLLFADDNDTIAENTVSDSEGNFSFSDLEPTAYKVQVEAEGFEPYTKEVIPTVNTPVVLGEVPLKAEADTDDGDDFTIWILLIIIVIVIIIIFAMIAMRKPKQIEEPYEEEYAEERVSAAPTAITTSRPVSTMTMPPPSHREFERREPGAVPTTKSMKSFQRCPMCAHKLMATGECFHCKMDQMYGRY